MYALAHPHEAAGTRFLEGTPVVLLAALALTAIGTWTAASAGLLPDALARAAGGGAAQGALLATAVGWTVARRREGSSGLLPVGIAIAALAGAAGAALAPVGAAAYLWAPLWIWRRRARLKGLGLVTLPGARVVGAGAALGALLGLHLAVTASLTLGYRVGPPAALALAPWLAYDLGANILAAECFFRGALFDRGHRRWSFGAATALSTGASVARYLLDPLLPGTLEVAAGAAFYIALLSVGNCWLYRRSGSVVPGFVAGVVFFAAYRLLHHVR